MEIKCISLEQTKAFSKIFLDYVHRQPSLESFYLRTPSPENFSLQMQEKNYPASSRKILAEALIKQYQSVLQIPQKQIDLLLQTNTFTVCTGHQLCLMTGPLYFIYKIITTINCCKTLAEKYPDHHFVPIFWMASEDHDFEEVNHFHLFGKKHSWQTDQKGAVGRFDTSGIREQMKEWGEIPELFQKAYLETKNLAEATRYLVHDLFGKEGLICVDGDDPALKNLFSAYLTKELYDQQSFVSVNESSQNLEERGYDAQIHPREINLFYLDDQLRERIIYEEGKWKVNHTSLSFGSEEIQELIQSHPERFSPNVVLRPLYQEVVLPNLAYIGGPGEIAYWLQLKGVFDLYQLRFPILLPRNFVTLFNKTSFKKLQKLNLQPEDLFLEINQLKNKFLSTQNGQEFSLEKETAELDQLFDQILQKAVALDKSLEGLVGAEKQKTLKSLENIEKRLKKTEENKLSVEINQLQTLKDKLFPNGGLQERGENVLNHLINQPGLIQLLLQNLDAFDFRMYLLLENEQ